MESMIFTFLLSLFLYLSFSFSFSALSRTLSRWTRWTTQTIAFSLSIFSFSVIPLRVSLNVGVQLRDTSLKNIAGGGGEGERAEERTTLNSQFPILYYVSKRRTRCVCEWRTWRIVVCKRETFANFAFERENAFRNDSTLMTIRYDLDIAPGYRKYLLSSISLSSFLFFPHVILFKNKCLKRLPATAHSWHSSGEDSPKNDRDMIDA